MSKVYSANEIAKYIIFLSSKNVISELDDREGITNLKLQKMLYLTQAYFLSTKNRPIFEDQIEAWTYGPVVKSVYRTYSGSSAAQISKIDNSDIMPEDKKYIEEVWGIFGKYSSSTLVDLTHKQSPWIDAFNREDKIIKNSEIENYFKGIFV